MKKNNNGEHAIPVVSSFHQRQRPRLPIFPNPKKPPQKAQTIIWFTAPGGEGTRGGYITEQLRGRGRGGATQNNITVAYIYTIKNNLRLKYQSYYV